MEQTVADKINFPLDFHLWCVDSLIDRKPPTEISAETAKKFITALHTDEVYPLDVSNNLNQGIRLEYKNDQSGRVTVHCESEGGVLVEWQSEDGEEVLCYVVSLDQEEVKTSGADLNFSEALSFIKDNLQDS